jgi:hypothetical protein
MLRILLIIVCISNSYLAVAQDPAKENLAPCGTPVGISSWLKQYAANPNDRIESKTGDTLWVALQVHLLAKNNASGRFPYDKVLDAFCRLNTDYAASNIQFYLFNPFHLINSTEWYAHSDIPQGIDMMLTNNVEGALNTYFVSDPAGNCGYNIPYGGIALGHGCAAASDHTWAHEAGHALSLPHPFIGWEGKTYSYSTQTPSVLTYDYTYFHDSVEIQVPAPLDTALVELMDGSNCSIAADLICDTRPDYLSYRWNCNTQNQSSVKQKDPNGVDFYSDGTLYMSYADDACQTRFSPEEIAVMRSNLMTEKWSWVAPSVPAPSVEGLAVALEPIQDHPEPVTGVKLVWGTVPNATHYLVQASRFSNFAVREVDVITTDTSIVTGALLLNKTYRWRVKAFNLWHACTNFNTPSTFLTVPFVATQAPDSEGWRCYPSLISGGQSIKMEIPGHWLGEEAVLSVFDLAGTSVWRVPMTLSTLETNLQLPSETWPSGLYHLGLTSIHGTKRQSIVLMR